MTDLSEEEHQRCSYCGSLFPIPIELHHAEADCEGMSQTGRPMSNQRVVVLTDEEIRDLLDAHMMWRVELGETAAQEGLVAKLHAALEHPEGITEDRRKHVEYVIRRAAADESRGERWTVEHFVNQVLKAALFPGEDNS